MAQSMTQRFPHRLTRSVVWMKAGTVLLVGSAIALLGSVMTQPAQAQVWRVNGGIQITVGESSSVGRVYVPRSVYPHSNSVYLAPSYPYYPSYPAGVYPRSTTIIRSDIEDSTLVNPVIIDSEIDDSTLINPVFVTPNYTNRRTTERRPACRTLAHLRAACQ